MLNNNLSIAKKVFKAKKHIALSTCVAMILGLLYAFIITPVYTSTAYIYPANLGLYSEESQTEQMLQFLYSNEIKLYLINKLQLAKHYKIDTTKQNYIQNLDDIIDSKIKITQTKYESIEIKASDRIADTAQLLVNETINGVNWLIENEHRKKYFETVKNSEIYLNYKKHEADSIQRLLNELNKKYEFLNVGIQLKEAAKNQYKMQAGSGKNNSLADLMSISEQLKDIEKTNKSNSLSELFTSINNYSLEYGKLNTYFGDQVNSWVLANNEYQKNLSEYLRKNTFTVMASSPAKSTTPSWPKYWVVVFICGVTMFIISCLYFIFIDHLKQAYAEISKE